MPDITMCQGQGCPYSAFCFRHIAKPDKYQSYFAKPPWYAGEGDKCKCDNFWDTRKEFMNEKEKSSN